VPKIVAISVPYPGVSRVCEEGEKLGLWEFVRLTDDQEVDVPASADLYILGAWHPVYGEILNAMRAQGKPRAVVLWTSSAGEVGLEPSEQDALVDVLADTRIERVWFADKALAEAWKEKGFYAPYPLYVPEVLPGPKLVPEPYMTLFCPSTAKKNIFTQLVAAVLIQLERPELTLYTNVQVSKVFHDTLKFKEMGWLAREQYEEVMRGSKLNFACSFAETFDYQAAEAALLWQVPSVCSYTIPWSPTIILGVTPAPVSNPNDAREIASRALQMMRYGTYFQDAARGWARRANPILAAALAKLTSASP